MGGGVPFHQAPLLDDKNITELRQVSPLFSGGGGGGGGKFLFQTFEISISIFNMQDCDLYLQNQYIRSEESDTIVSRQFLFKTLHQMIFKGTFPSK